MRTIKTSFYNSNTEFSYDKKFVLLFAYLFSEGYSACLELVLMKLSLQFPGLGTMLIKQLLKCPGDKERMRGPVVSVATVELIYQLGKKQDSSYQDR